MQTTQTRHRIPVAIISSSNPRRSSGIWRWTFFRIHYVCAGVARIRTGGFGQAQSGYYPWEWIAFWDLLIQPAFMFMAGVAIAIRAGTAQGAGRDRTPTLLARNGAEFAADPDEPDPDIDLGGKVILPTD